MEFLQRMKDLLGGGAGAFVEIFLLFIVIYLFFKFLRDSRGAPVLRGVLLVIGLSIVTMFLAAALLELEHITWVFEKLAALFFVALLIIFQPELRRGLLRLGLNPVFGSLVRASSPTIDQIVKGVTVMSQRSVGALIVIERKEPMTSYMEVGTRIDGEITSEILQSIFHPGSALHDGAVILRGNRIASAGCLLPLTENPELAKTLGTRHRAAMGLSEESDAVTIALSEETGKITLAVDGKLIQGVTPDDLRKQLARLVIETVEGGA